MKNINYVVDCRRQRVIETVGSCTMDNEFDPSGDDYEHYLNTMTLVGGWVSLLSRWTQ